MFHGALGMDPGMYWSEAQRKRKCTKRGLKVAHFVDVAIQDYRLYMIVLTKCGERMTSALR